MTEPSTPTRLARFIAWCRQDPLHRAVVALAVLSAFGVGLVLLRSVYTGKKSYNFLPWNLFLAWVPLIFALLAERVRRSRTALALLSLVWLTFLPNAPYIVTDLMHLRTTFGGPLWIDLLMVATLATAGLLVGIVSLRIMHGVVDRLWRKPALSWLLVVLTALLCGVGVYLGRFLRWNSWDLLRSPIEVLDDALNTLSGLRPLGFVAICGGLFLCVYLVVAALTPHPGQRPQPAASIDKV